MPSLLPAFDQSGRPPLRSGRDVRKPQPIGKLLVKQSDTGKRPATKSPTQLPGVVTRFNVARVCGAAAIAGPAPRITAETDNRRPRMTSPRRSVSVVATEAKKDRRTNARSLQLSSTACSSQPSSGEKPTVENTPPAGRRGLAARSSLATPTTVGESWSPLTWSLDPSTPTGTAVDSSPRAPCTKSDVSTPSAVELPPFPELPSPPTFLEYTAALLAAEGLVVRLQKQGAEHCLEIVDEGFAELVHHREGQFTEALHKGWTDCHIDLIKAAPLFSQATINQTSDVQETPWFLDEDKKSMKVQSQLLAHVYNATHPRDVFGDYYSAGPLGLSLSWDGQKYPEKRRIQNAVRRYLEFSLEAFLSDVCLGQTNNLNEISQAQEFLSHALLRPTMVGPLLRAQFRHLLSVAAADSSPPRRPTLSLKALDNTIDQLGWWPRELNQNDRTEILEAIALSSVKTQISFVKNSAFPHSIGEREYALALQWVPMNQPDFASQLEDGSLLEMATVGDINGILESVVKIASSLTKFISDADKLESRTLARETELAQLRAAHANSSKCHSSSQGFQVRGCLRNDVFTSQDFLLSNCVSIEELQMLHAAATIPANASLPDHNLGVSQIANMIRNFTPSKTRPNCPVLQDPRLIALAIDYVVGVTFFPMSHSERFTARSPLSTLSVRIEYNELRTRFKKSPLPLPPKPDCMPRAEITGGGQQSFVSAGNGEFVVQFLSPAEARLENRRAAERTREALEAASTAQWFGEDSSRQRKKSNESGAAAGSCTKEEFPALEVDENLLEPLVVLHATETLHHLQKLFVPSAHVTAEELQVSLNDEGLMKGDRQTWARFWRQSLDLSGSLSALCLSGQWGPLRWNTLREISLAYQALKNR